MFTRNKWDSDKMRTPLNVAAVIGWFILLPVAAMMAYDGLAVYGYITLLGVAFPLIGAWSLRAQKKPATIIVFNKEEAEVANQSFQRWYKRVLWGGRAMIALMAAAIIALLGWVGVFIVCGVLGESRLEKQFGIHDTKRLAVFIVGSIAVMSGVAFVTGLIG